MKVKIEQLQQSLAAIGLVDSANTLKSIASIYKLAFSDFSKEIQILNQTADIFDILEKSKLHERVEENIVLPSFTIETKNKRIVKDQESLQGYTKQEILIGLYNYLDAFIKHYMEVKLDRIPYPEQELYAKMIEVLRRASADLKKANQTMVKGVSKQSIWSGLGKMLRTAGQIHLYLSIVKDQSTRVKDNTWQMALRLVDYEKRLKPEELKRLEQLKSWSSRFQSLSFDLEEEMNSIEEEFMDQYSLTREELYQMIKSFRSPEKMSAYKEKVKDYVAENIESKTASIKYAQDDDDEDEDLSEAEEFLQRKAPITPPKGPKIPCEECNHPLKGYSTKDRTLYCDNCGAPAPMQPKAQEPKPSATKPSPGKFFYDLPARLREKEGDEVDYKKVVHRVISSASLTVDNKSRDLYPPGTIYRAYTYYLRPLFRDQYRALLRSSYQIYISLYQVQTVQSNLSKVLRGVAGRLETIHERAS